MKRITIISISAVLLFGGMFDTAAVAAERKLTPRADSPTAMVKCGAQLETVKAKLGATNRYVFTGLEVLANMRYCVETDKSPTEVVDERNTYRVPKGTVGWLAADGRVVLEGCVNDATCKGCSTPAAAASALSPPPTPTPLKVKPPRDAVTLRVMVWETPLEFLKEIQGKQSRDLGAIVNQARKDGRITQFSGNAGTFEVELNDLDWQGARSSRVGVNNNYNFTPGAVLPADFGSEKNTIEIPVVDGEGQLTFERKITLGESHLAIRAPATLKIAHPDGGILYSCAAKTAKRCAGTDMGKWHQQVQQLPWIRYHFFVIRHDSPRGG